MALYLKSDVNMKLTDLNVLNIHDLKTKSEYKSEYEDKAASNDAVIQNTSFYNAAVDYIHNNNLKSKVHTFVSKDLALTTKQLGSETVVTRLINLGVSPDYTARLLRRVIGTSSKLNHYGESYTEYVDEQEDLSKSTKLINAPRLLSDSITLEKITDGYLNNYLNFKQEHEYPISASGNVAVIFVGKVLSPLNNSRVFPVVAMSDDNKDSGKGSSAYAIRLVTPTSATYYGIRTELQNANSVDVFFNTKQVLNDNGTVSLNSTLTAYLDVLNNNSMINGKFENSTDYTTQYKQASLEKYADNLIKPHQFCIGAYEGVGVSGTGNLDYRNVIKFKHLVVLRDCTEQQVLDFAEFIRSTL